MFACLLACFACLFFALCPDSSRIVKFNLQVNKGIMHKVREKKENLEFGKGVA